MAEEKLSMRHRCAAARILRKDIASILPLVTFTFCKNTINDDYNDTAMILCKDIASMLCLQIKCSRTLSIEIHSDCVSSLFKCSPRKELFTLKI